jgi:predicted  nucleic acid-binding Zn-ribbon protein
MDADDKHLLAKHFSLGDIISLVTLLVVFAAGYGRLESQVTGMQAQLRELTEREITPGAATRLATVETEQAAVRRELIQARDDSMEFRREVRQSLERIEAKLDNHDRSSK